MTIATAPTDLGAAQARYWAEWAAAAPGTAEDVAAFYAHAAHLAADLDAWHATPERQSWTAALLAHVASIRAQRMAQGLPPAMQIVDIGCGAGHDLCALQAAQPASDLHGVEPNHRARAQAAQYATCTATVADAPIATADILTCFDVLEHLPDPEAFLGEIATRARPGAVLIETTGTQDISTPMHLPGNYGWHPGRCLEQHGWLRAWEQGRFRVWHRVHPAAPVRASVLLCAYRNCAIPTMLSIQNLCGVGGVLYDETNDVHLARVAESPWRVQLKYGDGLISRARSFIVSRWWAETADDVFLMIDDDITFTPEHAARLVALCREGHDIACAAYPVGDGSHLAVRQFAGGSVEFHKAAPPLEIEYAATGFMAVHRRVIDALMPTLPWCHVDEPWAFKPLFQPMTAPLGATLGYLSEDWAFCQRARDAGFRVWLDPTIRLGHLKTLEVSVSNMHAVAAISQGDT